MTPSDPYPLDVLAGVITTTSAGPCYRLETDDGKQYALYYPGGPTLTAGTRVGAKVTPLELRIYCGQGQHMRVLSLQPAS